LRKERTPRPETLAQVEAVLTAHPELSGFGLGLNYNFREPFAERQARHKVDRDEMLTPSGLVEFEDACAYIAAIGIRKTVNRNFTSYTWKHRAERWADTYICNGSMIAAAFHMGVKVQREGYKSPNAFLAIMSPKPPGAFQ
jgi:hypothetical protein